MATSRLIVGFCFSLWLLLLGIATVSSSPGHSAFIKPWIKGSSGQGGKEGGGAESDLQQRRPKDQSRPAGSQSVEGEGLGIGSHMRKIVRSGIPPALLFLFGTTESASASPLNPQAIVLKSPFFQGWLVRVTDHAKKGSFVLIIGSFSSRESEEYDEHYIFCGIDSKKTDENGRGLSECQLNCEIFPDPRSVTITGDKASNPLSRKLPFHYAPPTNITWRAAGLGQFTLNENVCTADLKFDNFRLSFNATHRLPWSPNNPDGGGPEGWLGYTNLLPCHYFVHSVGSPCEYRVDIQPQPFGPDPDESLLPLPPPAPFFPLVPEREGQRPSGGQGMDLDLDVQVPGALAHPEDRAAAGAAVLMAARGDGDRGGGSALRIGRRSKRHLRFIDAFAPAGQPTMDDYSAMDDFLSPRAEGPVADEADAPKQRSRILGRGLAHIEGNHGTFFPEGWVWAQAVTADNTASFSLVTGKFVIGPVAPMNSVLYLRTHNRTRVYRSTDMDRVHVRCIDHSRGEVSVTAESLKDGGKVELTIRGSPQSWMQRSPVIHIPTANGFSNNPGCRETYTALATVKCYRRVNARTDLVSLLRPEWQLEEELEFPLTALEFGAGFLTRIIRSSGEWRLPWSGGP